MRRERAHPHVCGEHKLGVTLSDEEKGSSPRMRGTLGCERQQDNRAGLIPTYAGNTIG